MRLVNVFVFLLVISSTNIFGQCPSNCEYFGLKRPGGVQAFIEFENDKGKWNINGPRSFNPGNNFEILWKLNDPNNPANVSGDYSYFNRFTIQDNGNVGIGTQFPSEKLAVNGKILAKEIIVKTGWSDFVFEKGYKLRSLTEVDTYVKANKHLPEIPSAKEVEEKGVEVGNMESLLLMKVEELTLYLIEQEKRLKEVEKQNKELLKIVKGVKK